MRPIDRSVLLFLFTVVLTWMWPGQVQAQSLSGTWLGSSGGVYTITQSGSTVTWDARDPASSPAWVHRFTGTMRGDLIEGDYVAVPPGRQTGGGHLTIRIVDASSLVLVSSSGATFGSSSWTRQTPVPGATNVSGTWTGSSGGVYTITQMGNQVTWDARDPASSPAWVHRFTGTISGDVIEGDYVAVPPGRQTGGGHLQIRVVDGSHLSLMGSSGSAFGSSSWTRQGSSGEYPPPPATAGLLIEAEQESASGIRPLAERPAPNMKEVSPAWRPRYSGTGDWYLAVGGEYLTYQVNIPVTGTYTMWIRDYVDRFQARGVRRVVVEWDGRPYGTFAEVDMDAPGDRGAFGWHRVGAGVSLTAGVHTLKVTKEATTAGAAILDAYYLTLNPSERPPEP